MTEYNNSGFDIWLNRLYTAAKEETNQVTQVTDKGHAREK
jgi:hypothetical protein